MNNDCKYVKRLPGKTAEMIYATAGKTDFMDGWTLVCTFSREWPVNRFFHALQHMMLHGGVDCLHCHLVLYDNSAIDALGKTLMEKAKQLEPVFLSVRVWKSWRLGGEGSIRSVKQHWSGSKLPYIYSMQKDVLEMVQTEMFVLLEDDTIPPYKDHPDCIMRLMQTLEMHEKVGAVTAIATGRSADKTQRMRLGVHMVDRDGNMIKWRLSPEPKLRGLQKVDACGWYCVAAKKVAWAAGFEGMEEYMYDLHRAHMDVCHTNNMVRKGWYILADFSLWCTHLWAAGREIIEWGKEQAETQLDYYVPEFKVWIEGVPIWSTEQMAVLRKLQKERMRLR